MNMKKESRILVTPLSLSWTSQGLNLGPPDYEPQRAIFHDIP